jgi:hypothetical protein
MYSPVQLPLPDSGTNESRIMYGSGNRTRSRGC